ncbi:flippase [Candidatus Auribacterota bacterium]
MNHSLNIIIDKIKGHRGFRKVFTNTTWLFAQRAIRAVVGLFVGVWVARYLGPQGFGALSYAVAFVFIFNAFAVLGLESVVIRDIVRDPDAKNELLGTAFALRLIAGVVTFLCVCALILIFRKGDSAVIWMVCIIAFGYIFQSFDTIDYYFKSQVLSKYSVFSKTGAFLLISILKVALILLGAPLTAFAWTFLFEIILGSVFLIAAYSANRNDIRQWRFDRAAALGLIKDSWPLIFSGLFVLLYMRIDQIMLGNMAGDSAVGQYSAAVRVSEMLFFIPVAVTISVFPAIVRSRERDEAVYMSRLQRLYDFLAWSALALSAVIAVFSGPLIHVLFGSEYAAAGAILAVHVWSCLFVFLCIASYQQLMAENLTKVVFIRTAAGAGVNILLNFVLIPRFGGVGAAAATVVSYFVMILLTGVNDKARINYTLFLNTLNIKRLRS